MSLNEADTTFREYIRTGVAVHLCDPIDCVRVDLVRQVRFEDVGADSLQELTGTGRLIYAQVAACKVAVGRAHASVVRGQQDANTNWLSRPRGKLSPTPTLQQFTLNYRRSSSREGPCMQALLPTANGSAQHKFYDDNL